MIIMFKNNFVSQIDRNAFGKFGQLSITNKI